MTIAEIITDSLPETGTVVLICPPALAAQIWAGCPDSARLVLVSDAARVAKVRRRVGQLPVLQANLAQLPLAPHSVGCVVAVDILSRTSRPDETLGALCEVVRPGGRLVVGERLMRSPTLRALRRLTTPSSRRLLPEDVCCLMLNADVMEIGQTWPTGYPERFVTSGSLRVI